MFAALTLVARRVSILCTLILALAACSTNKFTGQEQLSLGDQSTGRLAFTALQQEQQAHGPSDIPGASQRAEAITASLLEASGLDEDIDWTVSALGADVFNAWASGGHEVGVVTVYDGMQKRLDDDELGYVLGHEIAHVIHRHVGSRGAWSQVAQAGTMAAGLLAALAAGGENAGEAYALTTRLGGAAVGLGAMLPFNREQEREADKTGVVIAALAGFEPKGATGMVQAMLEVEQEQGGGAPLPFLSTHPLSADRYDFMQVNMPHIREIYRYSQGGPAPAPSNPLIGTLRLPGLRPENREQVVAAAYEGPGSLEEWTRLARQGRLPAAGAVIPESARKSEEPVARSFGPRHGQAQPVASAAASQTAPANGIIVGQYGSRVEGLGANVTLLKRFPQLSNYRSVVRKDRASGRWQLAYIGFGSPAAAGRACADIGGGCRPVQITGR